jgi:hypothetical protein
VRGCRSFVRFYFTEEGESGAYRTSSAGRWDPAMDADHHVRPPARPSCEGGRTARGHTSSPPRPTNVPTSTNQPTNRARTIVVRNVCYKEAFRGTRADGSPPPPRSQNSRGVRTLRSIGGGSHWASFEFAFSFGTGTATVPPSRVRQLFVFPAFTSSVPCAPAAHIHHFLFLDLAILAWPSLALVDSHDDHRVRAAAPTILYP